MIRPNREEGPVVRVLRGHVDAASAFIVDDYPYDRSRKIRTKIRYWLEPGGSGGKRNQFRFVYQTLNPKTGRWNKPHADTYVPLWLFLCEYENEHVDRVPGPVSSWPQDWVKFFNTGVWPLLEDSERAEIAEFLRLASLRNSQTWEAWPVTVDRMKALGVPTLEEWRALTEAGVVEGMYLDDKDYEYLRTYIATGGPDLRVPGWENAKAPVDLDAVDTTDEEAAR